MTDKMTITVLGQVQPMNLDDVPQQEGIKGTNIITLEEESKGNKVLQLLKYENEGCDSFYRVKFSTETGGESHPVSKYKEAKMIYGLCRRIFLA